ncbi:Bax inhibitor-1 family protein [Granulicella cerasi]|uniref:Bax inhibitor-1 family protein n=1 Tax=Granulicella cerasi TaxID=741063 RepID=A0ABW1Z9N9_9BACT|nr:Bax inhibitor-1 family protein [Granulicella cerasi]
MRTIDMTNGARVVSTRSTASLLSQVLWITAAGFVTTAAGAYVAPMLLGGIGFGVLFLATFALILAVNMTARKSPGLALVLFYAFTFLMGVEVGPVIKAYLHIPGGQLVVFQAAGTTALGMAIMAVVAQIANFDYQRVGRTAFWCLIGLCLVGLLGSFVHIVSPGLYAWASLAIFSVLLLVDFMRLRDGAMGLAPVQMALSIYLDALNIFMALLQIFGGSNNSRSRN